MLNDPFSGKNLDLSSMFIPEIVKFMRENAVSDEDLTFLCFFTLCILIILEASAALYFL